MDGPPNPPTPYRDGKPLSEIIPPDTRRQRTVALVLSSMVVGVCLWMLGGWALEMLAADRPGPRAITVPLTPGYVAGRINPGILEGPGGHIAMPPKGLSVVHVWLQGCADCMPAFEAMRDLQSKGGLGVKVPIINVAYGEADETWATRYGVNQNLVFDIGGAIVVKPLGIGTFTTLVVDADGVILLRDRPDRSGYRDRVRAALGPKNLDFADPLFDEPAVPEHGLDQVAVERVVASHRSAVKRTCWERSGDQAPTTVKTTVKLTIGTDGQVSEATATGDDPVMAKCIEKQTKTWVFPAPSSSTTVSIPFVFVRQ